MDASLYSVLVHAHSVGRWIVLLLLVFAILNSLIAGNRPFIKSDNRLGLLLTIFADLMLVVGVVLWYFGQRGYKLIENMGGMSPVMKDPNARFFAVEHFAGMLIAIILMHIGKAQARKSIGDRAKHRRTMIFYLLALLIILVSIPWPFRAAGAGSHWF
jgi:L-asparagine transporter-like permease